MDSILSALFVGVIGGTIVYIFHSIFNATAKGVIKNNPKYRMSNINLGIKALENKKYNEAINYFNNIDKEPIDEIFYLAELLKGFTLILQGNVSSSKKLILTFVDNISVIQRDDVKTFIPIGYLCLGYIYFEEGNIILAKEYKEKALSIEPNIIDEYPFFSIKYISL